MPEPARGVFSSATPQPMNVRQIWSSRSSRSVITRKVKLPGTTRRTFSAKNAIEYDLPLPCVCQKTPSRPRSGCARFDQRQLVVLGDLWRPDAAIGRSLRRPLGSHAQLRLGHCGMRSAARSGGNCRFNSSWRRTEATALFTPSTWWLRATILRVPPGPAVVEQDEVLDQIEQPLLGQHAVEQRLGVHASLVLLGVALPLDEVLPLAGDRAVAGLVAVAHHQEGVVVEGVGDAVLAQVVGEVVVEAGADVPIDGLQLDEDQRQAVDEADQVRRAGCSGAPARPGSSAPARRGSGCWLAIGDPLRKSITCARACRVSPAASRHSTGTPSRMKP